MNRMPVVSLAVARCVFFLAAGVYLGGVVGLGAVAAPKIFGTLKSTGAVGTAAIYLSDPRQLGGEVFGNVLAGFRPVEIGCAIAMMLATFVETGVLGGQLLGRGWQVVKLALLTAIVGLLLYDVTLTTQVWEVRSQWRSAMGTPAESNLKAQFDTLHQRAELIAHLKMYVLVAMICVTAAGTAWRENAPAKEIKRA